MKVYYHAGLRDLAEAAGYRGETVLSLPKCSNFKRTHRFIFQVWEAIYRHMSSCFLSNHRENTENMLGGLSKLQTGSIKMMAPLFTAFDKPHSQQNYSPAPSRSTNTTWEYPSFLWRGSFCLQHIRQQHALSGSQCSTWDAHKQGYHGSCG